MVRLAYISRKVSVFLAKMKFWGNASCKNSIAISFSFKKLKIKVEIFLPFWAKTTSKLTKISIFSQLFKVDFDDISLIDKLYIVFFFNYGV